MSKVTERNSSHKLACHLPIDSVWRQLWARDTQHKRLREISIRLKWVITLLHKIVSLIWHCQEWSHGYSHLVVQARALKSTIGQSLRDRVLGGQEMAYLLWNGWGLDKPVLQPRTYVHLYKEDNTWIVAVFLFWATNLTEHCTVDSAVFSFPANIVHMCCSATRPHCSVTSTCIQHKHKYMYSIDECIPCIGAEFKISGWKILPRTTAEVNIMNKLCWLLRNLGQK